MSLAVICTYSTYGSRCTAVSPMMMSNIFSGLLCICDFAVLKPSGGMATIFHAANLYHFLHTLLLFMVSFSRYPRLVSTAFVAPCRDIVFTFVIDGWGQRNNKSIFIVNSMYNKITTLSSS